MAFRFRSRQVSDPAAQLNFEQLEGAIDEGITGPAGPEGPPGADGADGAAGADGTDGADGADGAPGEKWFTGSGAPSGTLTGSIVGDWYLNSANGDYYEKTATTTWTLRGNLKGPQGDPGADGADGADGAAGAGGDTAGCFSVFRSAALVLATNNVIVFDDDSTSPNAFDVSGWFSTSTGKFTPLVEGYYDLSWCVGSRDVQVADVQWTATLRKNGTQIKAGQVGVQRGSTFPVNSVGSAVVYANGTTDNFDILISHTAGAATNIAHTANGTFFHGSIIGRP